ncbi:O-acetyl-ADP-ribose deacetylase (regulator of RNase III), contains Macro domain [Prauserella flava]|nr:O-acetyl-ADP-ribose deacetylase (regulator of RNase III), contains Macro domain [Prauserella flava]MCR3734049.1 O-acetyl-ADP-ribose deacetylase (regulator of RNase III), contains Macro domain [Prauserella salsuginis]
MADVTGADRRPAAPEVVLCAVDEPLALAWESAAGKVSGPVSVHHGSVLDVGAHAVVSPANSYGWMRGGIDAMYAKAFPGIEQRVRSAVLAYHGGELPVGEALAVPTGEPTPAWLISAPTMREPGEQLPPDTVHPYLAAKAVFMLWAEGTADPAEGSDGTDGANGAVAGGAVPLREAVTTIALPGLGTGVGGVAPETCAHQVAAAWDEVFGS